MSENTDGAKKKSEKKLNTIYKTEIMKRFKAKVGYGSVINHSKYVSQLFDFIFEELRDNPKLIMNMEGVTFHTYITPVCNGYVPAAGKVMKTGGNRAIKVRVSYHNQALLFGRIEKTTKYTKKK